MLNKSQVESIAKHLRELAQIFESSNKTTTVTNSVVEEDEQSLGLIRRLDKLKLHEPSMPQSK